MNGTQSLELPAELLYSARMTLEEVRLELAILLFRLERISMGRAAGFAGMAAGDFLTCLAARKMGPHYEVEDALKDAALLAELRESK